MKRFFALSCLALVAVLVASVTQVAPAQAATVSSDFATDADGWAVAQNVSSITWNSAAGNPSGHICATENDGSFDNEFWRFIAPGKFLGNQSDKYGGALSFDMRQDAIDAQAYGADVIISNGNSTLTYNRADNPGTTWMTNVVPFTAGKGWVLEGTTTAASAGDIQAVLANLTRLEIRGDFQTRASSGQTCLDNVIFSDQAAPPTTPISSFDSTFESWFISNADTSGLAWSSAGGNPSGHICASDNDGSFEGTIWYFFAPNKFLGDQSAFYGGSLSFDLRQDLILDQHYDNADVIISDGSSTLTYSWADNPGLGWTSVRISLLASAGWLLEGTEVAPSESDFQNVLANLTRLEIRGDYQTRTTGETCLDNVAISAQAAPVPLPQSTFDSTFESWFVSNADTGDLGWSAVGGNPSGHICASDNDGSFEGTIWYFFAPSKFLKDQSDAYGANLKFDMRQLNVNSPQSGAKAIILKSGSTVLTYDIADGPGTSWTSYSIPLANGQGWVIENTTIDPSEGEFRTVLANLDALWIQGDWQTDTTTQTCLDNVILESAVLSNSSLISPTGTLEATPNLTLTWNASLGAENYQVDVYNQFGTAYSQLVSASACANNVCSVEITTGNVVGEYDVYIQARSSDKNSSWTLSEFVFIPGGSVLSAPTNRVEPTESINLTFPLPNGAYFVVADIYYPNGGYSRQVIESPQCVNGNCVVNIPSYGLWGEYSVWLVSGYWPYFGNWTNSTFRVGAADVTLTSPVGNASLTSNVNLTFNMPANAYYVVADVYWPNGGYNRYVVEAPSCPGGVCSLSIPSYGLGGEYGVWIIPGFGNQFGNWAFSGFTLGGGDIAALSTDEVDVLGSAAPELPALDTSAVEAAVEGPGN